MRYIHLFVCCLALIPLHAAEVGIVEDFALAEDREAVLAQLVPGSVEHSFYRCLLLQQRGELDAVDELLARWQREHGDSPRCEEIRARQLLLRTGGDRDAALDAIADHLDLQPLHGTRSGERERDLPSRLDQQRIAWPAFKNLAKLVYKRGSSFALDGFSDAGVLRLVTESDFGERSRVLERLPLADHPQLLGLVIADLADRHTPDFGTRPIHAGLTRTQLATIAERRPQSLENERFVHAMIRRLAPPAPAVAERNPDVRHAWLDRLATFATTLPQTHDALKAHILYHRLANDLRHGVHRAEHLLAYLAIPRRVTYAHKRWLQRHRHRAVALDAAFTDATGLPPIGDDSALVREYLLHLLREAESPKAYAAYLDHDWLERVFVESKVLHGIGDTADWFARLDDPQWFQALRERVDLGFTAENPERFAVDAPVVLAVQTKNVEQLIVRTFIIDPLAYYREHDRDIALDIDLDGLVANHEQVIAIEAQPLRRIRREITVPGLERRGVAVVELIGNGRRARALVRKGTLRLRERFGAAGHAITVHDTAGRRLRDSRIHFGNRSFVADDRGVIRIPFAAQPALKTIVIEHEGFAVRETLSHRGEHYALRGAFHVERESLLPGATATVLLRPRLTTHGEPIDLSLLEQPQLTITAELAGGIMTTLAQTAIEPAPGRELTLSITVPEQLRQLHCRLSASLTRLTDGERIELHDEHSFARATLRQSHHIAAAHLRRTAAGYSLSCRGHNGEPLAGQTLEVAVTHRLVRLPLTIALRSDSAGRIDLGELADIEHIRVTFPDGDERSYSWSLANQDPDGLRPIHLAAGTPLRIPRSGNRPPAREHIGFVELRGDAVFADHFAALRREPGFLIAEGLAPGDYRFYDHRAGTTRAVVIRDGERDEQCVLAADGTYELAPATPLQITTASLAGTTLQARIVGAGTSTRVHVLATRYWPRSSAAHRLALPRPEVGHRTFAVAAGAYADSVDLGSDLRYILARRAAEKFPGVMLERPSLLLNPWQLPEPASASDATSGADGFMANRSGGGSRSVIGRYGGSRARSRAAAGDPLLAFLPRPALVATNLTVGDDGSVTFDDPRLATAGLVRLVAVDQHRCVQTTLPGIENPLEPRDLRTVHQHPSDHFRPRRRLLALAAGEQARLADSEHSAFSLIDSLPALFDHLRALVDDQRLERFRFLTRWHELEDDAKLAHYDDHACHELHLFLARRDPDFFARVIAPYLADKHQPTFVDRYLRDGDLGTFRDPYRFGRLNHLERALLAQARPELQPGIERAIAERLELDPQSPARFDHVFTTALHGRRALAGGGANQMLPPQPERKIDRIEPAPPPTAAEPAAAARQRRTEDAAARADLRRFYRGPGPTRILVESNYYRVEPERANASLLPPHRLWADLANAGPRPFLSTAALFADGSLTAALSALALSDLPFTAPAHTIDRGKGELRITAGGPLLLIAREVEVIAQLPDHQPMLLAQNAYRLGARHRHEQGDRVDDFIRDEFLINTPYATEVRLTNASSRRRRLDVLALLPAGSMPLADAAARGDRQLLLEPYATECFALAFYFPRPGDYTMPGAHASEDGELIAWSDPFTYHVLAEPTTVDTGSWAWIARHGETDAVFAFLDRVNLHTIDLAAIAWRMEDAAFYERLLDLLDRRRIYRPALWLFAFVHHDSDRAAQYLAHREDFLRRCGPYLDSPLLTIDPVERDWYQHREFKPLINPRRHPVGSRPRIANHALAAQYTALLEILARKPALDADDQLAVVYHLLLQDRIAAAQSRFATLERAAVTSKLPYDYCATYLAMARGDTAAARRLATPHAAHPIPRWRDRFRTVLAHLDAAAGKAVAVIDATQRAQVHDALAASEPQLALRRNGEQLVLDWQDIDQIELRFFFMDVELLFTRDPFRDGASGTTATPIAPNHRRTVEPVTADGTMQLPLPAAVTNRNVLVEAVGGGKRRSLSLYSNAMDVDFVEAYGQVVVAESATGAPLDTVYVKVYRRDRAGRVHFHKDGYTDLRGRFDYVAVNEVDLADTAAFAVLVLSEKHGAVVEQVTPPAQ